MANTKAFRVSDETHKVVKIKAIELGIKPDDLIRKAVEAYKAESK